jgi:hypothetical protein
MVRARVRREQVAYAEGRGLSRRRAWALLSVARSTFGYVSPLVARDAPVVGPLRRAYRSRSAGGGGAWRRAARVRCGRRPSNRAAMSSINGFAGMLEVTGRILPRSDEGRLPR